MYFRDRFKTFGTVSSVEVIRRTDEKGMYMFDVYMYWYNWIIG